MGWEVGMRLQGVERGEVTEVVATMSMLDTATTI